MKDANKIKQAYEYAKEIYAELGVDVDLAMEEAKKVPISMNCWQGDDVIGFDADSLTGGIATTGNYPGRARTADELRADIDEAMKLIPGKKKLNLHASYAEKNGEKVDRDAYTIKHFDNWLNWAKERKIGLDFNPTYFSHPMMDGDFSLASPKKEVRDFWIEHGKRCREIGEEFAKTLGEPCVINYWMPDGYKDLPADTRKPRERMIESLDAIFNAKQIDTKYVKDAIESKLFGLGIESYTVASNEFSYGYAVSRKKLYTLDAGHFHPTEVISAKFSAVFCYLDEILLHVSRPVRWDSDHVVLFDDELQSIMKEIVRGDYLERTNIGLDFFDASINRVAAWVIGTRNAQKALLMALLEPTDKLRQYEDERNYAARLGLMEECKSLPFAAVWDYYCLQQDVPVSTAWLDEVARYERDVQSKR